MLRSKVHTTKCTWHLLFSYKTNGSFSKLRTTHLRAVFLRRWHRHSAPVVTRGGRLGPGELGGWRRSELAGPWPHESRLACSVRRALSRCRHACMHCCCYEEYVEVEPPWTKRFNRHAQNGHGHERLGNRPTGQDETCQLVGARCGRAGMARRGHSTGVASAV